MTKSHLLTCAILFFAPTALLAQAAKLPSEQVEENRRFEQIYEVQTNETFSTAGRRWALNEGVEFQWDYPTDMRVATLEQKERLELAVALNVNQNGGVVKKLVAAIDGLAQSLNRQINSVDAPSGQRGGLPVAKVCAFGLDQTRLTVVRVTWVGENCGAVNR